MELKIDKELECLIPPLSASEFDQLETSVLEEGFRDKLIVWNGTLVDGHNRYRIAQKHGLEFEITEKEFDSKEDVKDWMYKNQLGRRNLTPEMKDYCIGQIYRSEKKKLSERGNQYTESAKAQNGQKQTTAEKVGEQHGVSRNTVKRSEKFADGIDRIGEIAPEIKQDILKGKTNVTKTEIRELAKATDEEVSAAVDGIRNPKPKRETKTEEEKEMEQIKVIKEFAAQLKKPSPVSGDGSKIQYVDPIITDLTEKIKYFINEVAEYQYISERVSPELNSLIKSAIERLQNINSKIKEK